MPAVQFLSDTLLADHFQAIEPTARELFRQELLDDSRQRFGLMAHALLTFETDRLSAHPPADVWWTRVYWFHRVRRAHELLEHAGRECGNDYDTERHLLEDGAELGEDIDWEQFDAVTGRATADTEAALGPGPFDRPAFACGDMRPLEPGE